ncbi:Protein VASCULAR ASSOCIATED DEATH 1, chloroplastic [Linum grandiflorum]
MWTEENFDAPDISALYTKVGETKFQIKVEEFFGLFFSDDSTGFTESFHSRCGDKDFRCTSWKPDEKFGNVRNVSFMHPIKIYFGARFGTCQEVQKFKVYKNGHLVIGTSQEINDIPYGDYFRVEGLWDVVRDVDGSNEGCILEVYVGVAFSKKTVFKGKIVQSTLEECREAYGMWINMLEFNRPSLIKHPNFVLVAEVCPAGSSANPEVHSEIELRNGDASERTPPFSDQRSPQMADSSVVSRQHVESFVHQNTANGPPLSSFLGRYRTRLYTFFKRQSQVSMILLVAFVLIFLMQVSIVVLLNRPQPEQVVITLPGERFVESFGRDRGSEQSSDEAAWVERRIYLLKEEMLMVEARLERMKQEHGWLKLQIKDLETTGTSGFNE